VSFCVFLDLISSNAALLSKDDQRPKIRKTPLKERVTRPNFKGVIYPDGSLEALQTLPTLILTSCTQSNNHDVFCQCKHPEKNPLVKAGSTK
jgi:hypothetical protein